MKLVFIHGPAAVGKLTVGQALSQLTGLPLFHNHLVVDTLLAVFPFGSPSFVRLREEMWLSVFAAAAQEGRSLIFTFAPESTVRPDFPGRVQATLAEAGGEVVFVALTCDLEELENRVENESRRRFRKLRSLELFRQLRADGLNRYPALPADLTLDTGVLAPETTARKIAELAALG